MASLGPEWHLSSEGLKTVTQNGAANDKQYLLKTALDLDLKEIGQAFLAEELPKGRTSKIVLQIQKVRNIAAPKANEGSQAAPRMLKLVLTDGVSYAQAIETSTIPSISRDKTPPGTKLLLNGVKIVSGYLLINANNCTLLGGKVPHLCEKWELAKSVQQHNRQSSTSGAPPWVNFGSKIQTTQDPQFKSLDNKAKDASKENCEFEQLRKDAIAEASTGAIRKVFGGGGIVRQPAQNKQNYTENSNRERNNKPPRSKNVKNEDEKPQKPSERVSLFDFLEDKLPVKEAINDTFNTTNKSNDISQVTVPNNNRQPNSNYNNRQPNSNYNNRQPNSDYNKARQAATYSPHGDYNRKPDYKPEAKNFNHQYHISEQKPVRNKTQPSRNNNHNNNNERNRISQPDIRSSKTINNSDQQNVKNSVDRLTNDVNRISLSNSEFASRSLRQHLNLGAGNRKQAPESFPPKNNVSNVSQQWRWNPGDLCLAKYWEDGKYYDAIVTAITDKTCVVRFNGYGNIEEVLRSDCLPVTNRQDNGMRGDDSFSQQGYTGPVEFRRNTKIYSKRQ